ncbi:MAG: hypothetical protein WCH11_02165 [Bdellovibrio sp.]
MIEVSKMTKLMDHNRVNDRLRSKDELAIQIQGGGSSGISTQTPPARTKTL